LGNYRCSIPGSSYADAISVLTFGGNLKLEQNLRFFSNIFNVQLHHRLFQPTRHHQLPLDVTSMKLPVVMVDVSLVRIFTMVKMIVVIIVMKLDVSFSFGFDVLIICVLICFFFQQLVQVVKENDF
jgi:hypothetical protein